LKLFKLPRRVARKIHRKYLLAFENIGISVEQQDKLFQSLGLDRKKAMEVLVEICEQEFGLSYDESDGMFSEHLVILAAISLTNHNFQNILEIGTYDGRCAVILSRLYPSSKVCTIDLPVNDSDFSETYRREDSHLFLKERDSYLGRFENIDFQERNSLSMTFESNPYDLIWVDGAHGFPVVTMDIVNSCRLVSENGWVVLDDVYKEVLEEDKWYVSTAAFQTLESLKDSSQIEDYFLVPKRLGSEFNLPFEKKFVGIFRKKKIQ